MYQRFFVLLPLLAAMAFVPTLVGGSDQPGSPTGRPPGARAQAFQSSKDVLVTVNGNPIREADLSLALSRPGHEKNLAPERRENVLESVIQQELICQRAIELGLDADPTYQEKLHRMEAEINAFKREELAGLFWRELARRAEVSEAEANQYFVEHATRIRTELHVWQILLRKESLIEQALKDLRQGASFEDVAGRRFPKKLPATAGKPWDLGYLKWTQVPKAWRNVVYELKKGETSGVIRGPNSRFWIIKLVDKREHPDVTFESSKPAIMEVLKSEKIEQLRAQTRRDLRANARIVYSKGPVEAREE